jgi:hypothetical protein
MQVHVARAHRVDAGPAAGHARIAPQLDVGDVLLVLGEARDALRRVDQLLAAERVHGPVERECVRHPIEGRLAGGELQLRVAVLVAQEDVRLIRE